MIALVIAAAAVLWTLLGLLACVALGMSIAQADRAEQPEKSCCPHPPEDAPETVRGEFRAVVVPMPAPRRGNQLDMLL